MKEDLEEIRLNALNHIRRILPSIKSLEMELEELREEYKGYKEQYKDADYALAENDGRLEKVTTGKSMRRAKPLTLDQVKNVARELGIKL